MKPRDEALRHVFVVTNDLHPYGAQRVSRDVAGALAEHVERITLVTMEKEKATEHPVPEGVSHVRLNRRSRGPLGYLDLVLGLCRLLRSQRPDAVLSHMIFSNLITLAATGLTRIRPVVVVEHSVPENLTAERMTGVLRALAKLLYPRADRLVGVSDEVTVRTVATYGLDPARTTTILNPIDGAELARRATQPSGHPWLGVGEGGPVAVCVGAFRWVKGQDVLLRAIARIRDLRVVFVGDGELLASARELAATLGVGDRVEFVGFRADAVSFMRESDAVVVPSRWEGFGLVAAEAAAVGARVVASDVSGLREVIGLLGGSLFPPEDDEELSKILQSVLEEGASAGPRDSETRRALDRLDPQVVAKHYLSLLVEARLGSTIALTANAAGREGNHR